MFFSLSVRICMKKARMSPRLSLFDLPFRTCFLPLIFCRSRKSLRPYRLGYLRGQADKIHPRGKQYA